MKIEYCPIGIVRSPHETTTGTPIQPSRARGIEGTVEINEEYVEALSDLDGFSHIILICHLHRASDFKLKVVPIEGVDLLDGTPVLDIKPYVRDFDDRTDVCCGWLDEVRDRETVADDRFER
ncbi:MAG: SAM-dependent methyltransferase [Acidobacteria bacterium]|nr:SAM-dependent methyltransferase [Candidatus Sulfomarinibacter kjeldsenii]